MRKVRERLSENLLCFSAGPQALRAAAPLPFSQLLGLLKLLFPFLFLLHFQGCLGH